MARSFVAALCLLIVACGGAQPVTFCERLEADAARLKSILKACPGSGDDNLYAFSMSKCEATAVKDCTAKEQTTLLAVGDCEAKIAVCFLASDRDRAVTAIQKCTAEASIGSACGSALSP